MAFGATEKAGICSFCLAAVTTGGAPASRMFAGRIKNNCFVIGAAATQHADQYKQNQTTSEISHCFLLSVARHAAFVIGSAVTAVAAGRIKFAFDLVQGHEVAAVRHLHVRAVAVFYGRLHFDLVGMAVGAEGGFVTRGAEPVIRRSVEAVILDKGPGMAKGV
jgi:hypothetical protein